MAILKSTPFALLKGLPKTDKESIRDIVGKSILLVSHKDGEAELEFVDKNGNTHNIWVNEKFVTFENGEK
jgi:hypothetical protein